jgi:hypothetical protein
MSQPAVIPVRCDAVDIRAAADTVTAAVAPFPGEASYGERRPASWL